MIKQLHRRIAAHVKIKSKRSLSRFWFACFSTTQQRFFVFLFLLARYDVESCIVRRG